MSGLVASELTKIRTARSSFVVCVLAVGLTIGFGLLAVLANEFSDPPGEVLISVGQFCVLFTLVLGVMAIAGEHRNGTLAPTLVVTPSRSRLLLAKLIAVGLVGFTVGALSFGACLALGALLLPSRDFELGLSGGEVALAIATGGALAAAYAAMGLGVGAMVRNQTATIVLGLLFLFFVDPLLAALFDGYAPYSLGGLLAAATGAASQGPAADSLSRFAALALSVIYAAGLVTLGLLAFERAEITD